jgi:hypothetical protein
MFTRRGSCIRPFEPALGGPKRLMRLFHGACTGALGSKGSRWLAFHRSRQILQVLFQPPHSLGYSTFGMTAKTDLRIAARTYLVSAKFVLSPFWPGDWSIAVRKQLALGDI